MRSKIPVLIFVFSGICRLQAQQVQSADNFSLRGNLTGPAGGTLTLSYMNKAGKYINDTTHVKNGAFVFYGTIEGPVYAMLTGATKSRSVDDPNLAEIFLSPAPMSISLTENDFKHNKMTGSVMQDDMNQLNRMKAGNIELEYKLGLELKKINDAAETGKNTDALNIKRDSVYRIYQRYREQDKKIEYIFITTHPASYLSPYLMHYYFGSRKLPLDSAQMFFNTFTPFVKRSVAGRQINEEINARLASSPGRMAPVFTKADIKGNKLDITSFRSKNYVLLDFWASWCEPCREETPRLKQLYKKFHQGGLEIVSISWDAKEKDWKDAISKDSTGMWRHILADMYLPDDNSMRNKYSIAGIPSYILVDKKGIIIGRYRGGNDEGSTDDLEKKLSALIDAK